VRLTPRSLDFARDDKVESVPVLDPSLALLRADKVGARMTARGGSQGEEWLEQVLRARSFDVAQDDGGGNGWNGRRTT
jgi:hypothetical protein